MVVSIMKKRGGCNFMRHNSSPHWDTCFLNSCVSQSQPASPNLIKRTNQMPGLAISEAWMSAYHGECKYGSTPGSPATDMVCRRSIFSRKNYGSVERLSQEDNYELINTAGRFRMESGEIYPDSVNQMHHPNHTTDNPNVVPHSILENSTNQTTALYVENPESETRWYFKYFLGRVHQVYVGYNGEHEPFLLVYLFTYSDESSTAQYRAILWRAQGSQKICIPHNSPAPLSVKKILSYFDIFRCEKGPFSISDPKVQKDILTLEEQEGSINFKFGLLYFKEGQQTDEEMYNNKTGSEEFYNFASLLGKRIKLKGWDRFKGGLDAKSDTTGKESYYTVYDGHEIMFHVSTLLPYLGDNKQQVERKRHIGNDIVNIIFVESSSLNSPFTWKPCAMKTHFTHIYAVVCYDKTRQTYKLHVYSEETVPLFGPVLPCPSEFKDHNYFREFLLVKLMNGEKAAFKTPVFAQKRQRTLEMLLKTIFDSYTAPNNKSHHIFRKAFSDIVPDQQFGISTRKDVSRTQDFMRIGQCLKVEAIMNGQAPTSLETTGTPKQIPWRPILFHPNFPYGIFCGDIIENKLIISSEGGTYIADDSGSVNQIIPSNFCVKQIEVLEHIGQIVLRIDKGRESRIIVMTIHDFESLNSEFFKSRDALKMNYLPRTKGCHLFAVDPDLIKQSVRLVVAVGRRLLVFVSRYYNKCSTLSDWNQLQDYKLTAQFEFENEFVTNEPVQLITLTENSYNGGAPAICVAYKGHFDLINQSTGETFHLYQSDSGKCNPVAALDISDNDRPEILLVFNRCCHFQPLKTILPYSSNNSTDEDFTWINEPYKVVLCIPYIIGFSNHSVEIRMLVNGSLVHAFDVTDCVFISSKSDIFFASKDDNLEELISHSQKSATTSNVGSPKIQQGLQVAAQAKLINSANFESSDVIPENVSHIYRISVWNLVGRLTNSRPLYSHDDWTSIIEDQTHLNSRAAELDLQIDNQCCSSPFEKKRFFHSQLLPNAFHLRGSNSSLNIEADDPL